MCGRACYEADVEYVFEKKNLVDRVAGEQLNTCCASALAPDVCVYVANTCDFIPINHF